MTREVGFWKRVWGGRIHGLGFLREDFFYGFDGLKEVRCRFGRLKIVPAPSHGLEGDFERANAAITWL